MSKAMGDGGVDCVLGDVALDAEVVVLGSDGGVGGVGKRAALLFHLVGGLPGSGDDFADAAHGLGVGADDADGAEVVEDVFGGDCFAADSALGERDVFGEIFV